MDKIYDENNVIIADVRTITKTKRSNKNITRLLNGKSLVQIIGEPTVVLLVSCYANYENKLKIDDINADGKNIKALHKNAMYTGIIEGDIYWEPFYESIDEKVFQGEFEIIVNE